MGVALAFGTDVNKQDGSRPWLATGAVAGFPKSAKLGNEQRRLPSLTAARGQQKGRQTSVDPVSNVTGSSVQGQIMPDMPSRKHWLLAPACILALGGVALPTVAVSQNLLEALDHDSALDARRRGEILPLEVVLARVRSSLGGEVVGVSLERSGQQWVYGFRVFGTDGNRATVHVDARTAQIIGRGND
jgi:hypothetical protein